MIDHTVTGPVLVLSSSLGTTAAMCDPQAAALAERFRAGNPAAVECAHLINVERPEEA